MKKSVNIITLGCSKNLVDSEKLLKQLDSNGFEIKHDSNDKSDIIIINTCGFINDAKQESIDTILDAINAKKNGFVDKVFVIGCLSERYADDLRTELPEVDEYFGTYDIKKILASLNTEYRDSLINERVVTTPQHIAYLKISDGCNRGCGFCAIPLIKGKHTSRPIEELIEEAKSLIANGTKEIILIAQDLSLYGIDIYKKQALVQLIEKLCTLKGLDWLRLQYIYPNDFPLEVLDLMAKHRKICNYLDIPIQHISNKVLKNMRRNISKDEIIELLKTFKQKVPDMALRTTLLVGHPGEGESEFQELLQFVKDVKFDRLGVFAYSEEEGTNSCIKYSDDIPQEEKQRRVDEIMLVQQDISLELNRNKIGKTFKVLIDRHEGDVYIGRTQYDTFEVDNEVIVEHNDLQIGEFYKVKVVDVEDFDLYGKICK